MTTEQFPSTAEDAPRHGPVRPLDVGEMLDHVIAMVRDRFKLFFVIAACLLLPYNILGGIMIHIFDVMMIQQPIPADPGAPVTPWATFGGALFFVLYMGLFVAVVIPLTSAAVIHAGGRLYVGDASVTARECWRRAFRVARRSIPAVILYSIATGIGYGLCIIPGVLLQIIWFVHLTVLVIEDSGVIESFRRSFHLMRGHKLKAFVILIVIGVISVFSSGWAAIPLGGVLTVTAVIIEALIESILQIGGFLMSVAMYFSARSQVEHLDLDLMVRETAVETGEEVVL